MSFLRQGSGSIHCCMHCSGSLSVNTSTPMFTYTIFPSKSWKLAEKTIFMKEMSLDIFIFKLSFDILTLSRPGLEAPSECRGSTRILISRSLPQHPRTRSKQPWSWSWPWPWPWTWSWSVFWPWPYFLPDPALYSLTHEVSNLVLDFEIDFDLLTLTLTLPLLMLRFRPPFTPSRTK